LKIKQIELDPATLTQLLKKAAKSDCTYRVAAIAFDKKGDVLGCVSNSHSAWDVVKSDGVGRPGTGVHCERTLMSRYGVNIKTIVICRIGHGGDLRPIEPCSVCQKAARKLGIKILTVSSSLR